MSVYPFPSSAQRRELDDLLVAMVDQVGAIQSSHQLTVMVKGFDARFTTSDVIFSIWRLVDTGHVVLNRHLEIVPAPLGGGPLGIG